MGKMRCRCGFVFDTTPQPEPDMWVAIKDTEHEAFLAAEIEADRLSKDYEEHQERVGELDRQSWAVRTLLYNCPTCGRIYWFRGPDGTMEVFVPEPPPET